MTSINRKIFKDSIVVTLLGLVGQGLGFVVTMLVAKKFGANWITDSYYLAFIIPGTFVGIIGGVVKIVFVPVFVEERINNPENVSEIIGSIITAMLIASIVGVIIVATLSYSNVLSFGQSPEARALTQVLLIELLPLIPLTILSGIFGAVYNSYQQFGLAEVANSVRYAVVVATLVFLSKSFGIHSLVFGHVVGQFFTLLLIGWIVHKKLGLDIRPRFTFNPAFKRMFRMSLLPFLSYVLAQFNPLISRLIASFLTVGSISVISYAQKLAVIPTLVIGTGFMGVIVSYWSKSAAEGDEQQLQNSVNRSVSMLLTILTPIVVGLYILREPLIRLLLQRGAFGDEAVVVTAGVFSIFIIAVVPTYLHMVICRVLFVKHDIVSLFWLSLLGMGLHSILSYVLAIVLQMGPKGIALSTLASGSIVTITTTFIVYKYHVRLSLQELGNSMLRIMGGCLIMVCIIFLFQHFAQALIIKGGLFFEIFSVSLIGGVIYIGFLRLVCHPDVIAIARLKKG